MSERSGSSVQERAADRDAALGAMLQEVTRAANAADSLVEAARTALRAVCRMTGWPVGHLVVPHATGTDFVSSGVWHIDGPQSFEALREVTAGTRFPAGVGLAGQARATGRP